MFKQTYVINLKRRPDKLKKFYEKCPIPKNEVILFEAVDGLDISESDPRLSIFHRYKTKNKAVIGCALSHYEIYKKIDQSNLKPKDLVAIFEDDAEFIEGYTKIIKKMKNNVPSDTELIYIGDHSPKLREMCDFSSNPWFATMPRTVYGTFAYAVTKKFATRMLEHIHKVGHVGASDWLLNEMHKASKYYCTNPALCISFINHDSDIQFTTERFIPSHQYLNSIDKIYFINPPPGNTDATTITNPLECFLGRIPFDKEAVTVYESTGNRLQDHVNISKMINPGEKYMVFEDGVLFRARFCDYWSLIEEVMPSCDIYYLSDFIGFQGFNVKKLYNHHFGLPNSINMSGYIMTHSGAQKLINSEKEDIEQRFMGLSCTQIIPNLIYVEKRK